MKKIAFILTILSFITVSMQAQDLKEIQLNQPDKTRGTSVMQALSDRHSDREYADKPLSLQDLSDLLWAANGINRPDGKRTAPSALNRQDISLRPIAKGDYRKAVAGGQDFVQTAPVSLVLVSDLSRFGDVSDRTRLMAAVDAGIVCQNINLFCAAAGLATVPRATMDQAALKKLLKLTDSQLPLMNNPVGYPKK